MDTYTEALPQLNEAGLSIGQQKCKKRSYDLQFTFLIELLFL